MFERFSYFSYFSYPKNTDKKSSISSTAMCSNDADGWTTVSSSTTKRKGKVVSPPLPPRQGNRLPVIDTMAYSKRVEHGKRGEMIILQKLEELGYRIREASPDEDKHDKIDGFLNFPTVGKDGENEIPIQVKYRQTGPHILLEIGFFGREGRFEMNGRDMIGKAGMYVCLSDDKKTLRLCDYSALKREASRMAVLFLSRREKETKVGRLPSTSYREEKCGEVRITQDKSSKRVKMLFFAFPEYFVKREHRLLETLDL